MSTLLSRSPFQAVMFALIILSAGCNKALYRNFTAEPDNYTEELKGESIAHVVGENITVQRDSLYEVFVQYDQVTTNRSPQRDTSLMEAIEGCFMRQGSGIRSFLTHDLSREVVEKVPLHQIMRAADYMHKEKKKEAERWGEEGEKWVPRPLPLQVKKTLDMISRVVEIPAESLMIDYSIYYDSKTVFVTIRDRKQQRGGRLQSAIIRAKFFSSMTFSGTDIFPDPCAPLDTVRLNSSTYIIGPDDQIGILEERVIDQQAALEKFTTDFQDDGCPTTPEVVDVLELLEGKVEEAEILVEEYGLLADQCGEQSRSFSGDSGEQREELSFSCGVIQGANLILNEECGGAVHISIFSANGILVLQQQMGAPGNVDLHAALATSPSGIYYVRLVGSEGQETLTYVK